MYTNSFISKATWCSEKMTDEEKQTLIGFYKHNPILWDDADPNYTSKSKKISH